MNWKNMTISEKQFHLAVNKLFANCDLLSFVFSAEHPRLRAEPEVILNEARGLSSGERLLVRLALDLWNDSGSVRIQELISRLDAMNFENAISAIRALGPHERWRSP